MYNKETVKPEIPALAPLFITRLGLKSIYSYVRVKKYTLTFYDITKPSSWQILDYRKRLMWL